ncbi:MAG: PAS domain S-box protein [Bacteroidota bacterium]|nr:PAS domain S-box protein [Bacteroidota bacterium]
MIQDDKLTMQKSNFIDTRKFSSVLIAGVIILPCLVLAGWQFDIAIFKSIFPSTRVINPVTAILFMLSSVSLYCLQEDKQQRIKIAGKYIALFMVLIASLLLFDIVAQSHFNIDQLLFTKKLQGNKISINSLLTFLLAGSSLLLINDRKKQYVNVSQLLAVSIFFISLLTITEYIYTAQLRVSNSLFISIPLYTAITFLLLSFAMLLSRSQKGFVSDFVQKNIGGVMVRKVLPAGLGIPIIIGFLRLEAQRLQLVDAEFGAALAIIFIISTFCILKLWLASSLNKTDEKRKETELRLINLRDELLSNEKKYRNLIENSGVIMYTSGIDGLFTYTSSKALQLTGYSSAELEGMHFADLVDAEWIEEVKAKYVNQLKNNLDETLLVFCIRTKYGDLKWVEQSATLIIENNQPVGFQCIVKDISERKEMEDVLRNYELELVKNQERLQSILDNATSFIYIKDLEGRYLVTNKQFKEAFNVGDEGLIGKTAFNFANPEQAQRFTNADNEVIRTSKHVEIEEIIETPDGNHHFLIIKFPLLDAQKNIYGLSGIGTDITERVKYEKDLIEAKKIAEDAKKLQEQFLANMSHEIRTPMNGIQGMTDLLLETKLTDEQNDFAKTIKRSSDSLLVIINDILDFSKIQAGKLTIEKIDFKLSEVVENTKAIFRQRIKDKGLSFQFTIDEAVPEVLSGDPTRLNQVLVNLLGNAIKFTHSGGINISASVESKTTEGIILQFAITDTGIGIEPHKINEMFESFTQASTDTSRKYGGTGLGLAISKQLVEMQHGNISVESKVDCGTTFKFSIPYTHSQTNNAPVFVAKDVVDYRTLLKDKKFLVAEDNEVNQKVIRHVLKKAGGLVTMANNGLEAVNFLEKDKDFDLIIMDLQMPEMDGYAATKHIRNVMKLSIPIIAMTASALKGEKSKCLAIGMNDYLSKPFDINFIYKRISYFLGCETTKEPTTMKLEQHNEEHTFDLSLLQEMDDNEYVSEILQIFLTNTPGELREFQNAANANQFEATFKMAHKIKGSAGLLQADEMLRILSKAEEFAKAGIKEGLPVLAQQATDEFKKMEGSLRQILKELQRSVQVSA